MMKRPVLCILPALLTVAFLPATAAAKSCRGSNGKDCFLLRAPSALIPTIAQAHNLETLRQIDPRNPDVVLVGGPQNALPEDIEAQVKEDPDVLGFESVQVAALIEFSGSSLADGTFAVLEGLTLSGEFTGPEDPYFTPTLWNGYLDQPATSTVNVDPTHALPHPEAMGEMAIVAVIDTGVDPDHPLLQGALVPGYDFLLDQPGIPSEWSALDPATAAQTEADLRAVAEQSFGAIVEGFGDTVFRNPATGVIVEQSFGAIVEGADVPSAFGHGTMVAGIVRLVAPRARIMPLRVFDGNGQGDVGDVIEAIYFAIDNGATVLNMSFSTAAHSEELLRAIKHAKKQKAMAVTSVGNEGKPILTYPAAYSETFGVASIDGDNQLSAFSNFGTDIAHVAAPGEGIITAYPGGLLAGAWGTSFSAAFVSGTVATLHDIDESGALKLPGHRRVLDALKNSAWQPDPANPIDEWGHGILDVYGAFGLGEQGY